MPLWQTSRTWLVLIWFQVGLLPLMKLYTSSGGLTLRKADRLWLDQNAAESDIVNSFPPGEMAMNARTDGTVTNLVVKTIAEGISALRQRINAVFQGLFIQDCTDRDIIKLWEATYNLPNDIFRALDTSRLDVYCIKYLMQGDTLWHFKAIANLYGVVLRAERDPDNWRVIHISFDEGRQGYGFPYRFAFPFGSTKGIFRVKSIYELIKPVYAEFVYEADFKATKQEIDDMIKFDFKD